MFVTIILSAICGMFLLEKTKIKDALLKFDSENKGPIYDLIKGCLFFGSHLICFACQFPSFFVWEYIISAKYAEAFQCFLTTFIAGIIFCFVIGVKE